MIDFSHFYSRYGLALTLIEKGPDADPSRLSPDDFSKLLEIGQLSFRVKPAEEWKGKEKVKYQTENLKRGDTESGIFLSPTIVSSDMTAQKLWENVEEFKAKLVNKESVYFNEKESVKQTFAPTAGEYNNGKSSRQTANITLMEAICCTITTISPDKPAFAQITIKDKKRSYSNTTILPDLPIHQLKQFITVFRRVSLFKTENLMVGNIYRTEDKGKVTEKPSRPMIFNGNFPHAPKSKALSALGLLGAIGEWAIEADDIGLAKDVLQSLESCPIYIVSADKVHITGYNHFVVKLAREARLGSVIDSLFYIQTYLTFKKPKTGDLKETKKYRDLVQRESDKVAFFAARFLHLFDEMAFREFLAIRAEYPAQLEILFKTFFMEKKLIDPPIVASARQLGEWLNRVAYIVSKEEVERDAASKSFDKKKKSEKIREEKAKILVELESSAFSAKTGSALIGQTVTRAGRLSQSDAPAEAQLFMEKTISGELELREAQQMLMAFSRLRSKLEPKLASAESTQTDEPDDEIEDFSDAQDND